MLIKEQVVLLLLALCTLADAQASKIIKAIINPVSVTLQDVQAKYGKRYGSEEQKVYRRVVLEQNKRKINDHNAKSQASFSLGENQFIDLSPQQFARKFTGLILPSQNSRQLVADTNSLKQLNDQNCYCSVDASLKKMDLQKRISKNQQEYTNLVNNHINKITTIDNAVNTTLDNIKKIIFPAVSPVLPSSSVMNIMGVSIASRSNQPTQTAPVLPNNIEDPVIIKAMAPILSINLMQSTGAVSSSIGIIDSTISLNPIDNIVSTVTSTVAAPSTVSSQITTISQRSSSSTSSFPVVQATLNGSTPLNPTSTIISSSAILTTTTLPDIDWSNKTGPVRYQGSCGACYAFTTAQVLQMCTATYMLGGLYLQLSAQQIVDCAPNIVNYNGCNGGLIQWGYSFMQTFGVTTNFKYPYTSGSTGTSNICKYKTGQFKINSYRSLDGTCTDLRNQLQLKPVATAVRSYGMQFYSSGVFDNCTSSYPIDHAVVIVGFNSTYGWKFKNTWGTTWGMNGYGWITLDQSKNCAICSYPVAPKCKGEPL